MFNKKLKKDMASLYEEVYNLRRARTYRDEVQQSREEGLRQSLAYLENMVTKHESFIEEVLGYEWEVNTSNGEYVRKEIVGE